MYLCFSGIPVIGGNGPDCTLLQLDSLLMDVVALVRQLADSLSSAATSVNTMSERLQKPFLENADEASALLCQYMAEYVFELQLPLSSPIFHGM
jgi:hypothetical protein